MVKKDDKLRYVVVKEALLRQIKSGGYCVGEKLPGERKIADTFNVSQMTANRAIQELAKEGYLEREMGVGTFVLSKNPHKNIAPKINIVLFGSLGQDINYEATLLTAEYLSKDIYMGTLLRSLMEVGSSHNCQFSFLTAATPMELEQYVEKADRLRERFILINPFYSWRDSIRKVGLSGLPVVSISARWKDMGVPFVDTDNYLGAKTAIYHLNNLGHRKIAVFYSWPETTNTKDRIQGAKDGMKELGLDVDEELFVNIDGFGKVALDLAHDVIGDLYGVKKFTAVFAAGFELALATNAALKLHGLEIPKDVSLVGFDDSPAAVYLQPPLTTVRQPFVEIAQRTIEILLDPTNKESQLIPVELVVRNSTAKAP